MIFNEVKIIDRVDYQSPLYLFIAVDFIGLSFCDSTIF